MRFVGTKSYDARLMARVRGIGGVFFKSPNPEALREWYAKHLGIVSQGEPGAMFPWNQPDSPCAENLTVWCIVRASTAYFQPSRSPLMVSYVVDDLRAMLDALRKEGVWVDPVEEYDYGKLGWIMDPDGNRSELWEPLPKKENH